MATTPTPSTPPITTFDTQEKPAETCWKSIYLSGFFALIQSAQFSVFFSSLWPYLKCLDPNFSERSLGYIITSYSLAQLFSAPLFGYWSNRINQTKLPLTAGFTLMALGNLLHFSAQLLPISVLPYLMGLARFTTGAGSGNSGLLRTHVSCASSCSDRSKAMSYVQGGMAVGTLLGPFIQLCFAPLSEDGFHAGIFHFNIYTAPALFLVFLNILGALMVQLFFKDVSHIVATTKEQSKGSSTVPLFVCIFTSFSHIFTLTTIETIASPYTMMMFSFSKEEAIMRNSIAHGSAGIISAAIFIIFIVFNCSRLLPERPTAIICQLVMGAMFVATFSYPQELTGFFWKSTAVSNCDSTKFKWCNDLTPISPWLFYFFYILIIGVAFTFLTIVVTTLYSKIIGSRKQGTLQGVYQMAGSAGRLTAPLIASNLYTWNAPRAVWIAQLVEIGTVLVLWFLFYRKLVPK